MNSQVGNAEHKNKKGVWRLTGTVTCWTRLSAETNTTATAFTVSTLLWIPLVSSSSFSIRIDNFFPKSILNSAKSCRSLVKSDKNSSNQRRNQNPDKNHKTLEFAPRIAVGRDWKSDGECEVKGSKEAELNTSKGRRHQTRASSRRLTRIRTVGTGNDTKRTVSMA